MTWQPLQVRQFGLDDGPYEGVPGHLAPKLWDWASIRLMPRDNFSKDAIQGAALLARIPLRADLGTRANYIELRDACLYSPAHFLAVIDALLALFGEKDQAWVESLELTLTAGNSAWTTAPDRKSLTRRVDPNAEAALAEAIAPQDAASRELTEAWRNAYGREPDPSDAWDHSIKAVEHVLKPVVCPNNTKATLANVVGQLRTQPQVWKLLLPGKDQDHGVDKLVAMLDLIWPNPDRHGGSHSRAATLDEARAVVQLAVTVVQWGRAGVLTKR